VDQLSGSYLPRGIMTTENKVINGGKNRLIQEGWTGGSPYSCQYVYDLNGSVTDETFLLAVVSPSRWIRVEG
jgi:hypothetical protein